MDLAWLSVYGSVCGSTDFAGFAWMGRNSFIYWESSGDACSQTMKSTILGIWSRFSLSLYYSPDAIMLENIIIVTNLLHLQIYVKQYECRRLAVMLYIMEHLEYVGIALTFSIWLWWSSEWRAQRHAYWTRWCKCTPEISVRFVHCSIFRWQGAVPCTLNQYELNIFWLWN